MSQDMDAMARARGFPDYATMAAFMRHRSESLKDSHTTTDASRADAAIRPNALSMTPAGILEYVRQRIDRAMSGQ